jgi:hypothetical protein
VSQAQSRGYRVLTLQVHSTTGSSSNCSPPIANYLHRDMPQVAHSRDLYTEHPNRTIVITKSDGDPNRYPEDKGDGSWQVVSQNDKHSKRWRGTVGTLLAALCGWESKVFL